MKFRGGLSLNGLNIWVSVLEYMYIYIKYVDEGVNIQIPVNKQTNTNQ